MKEAHNFKRYFGPKGVLSASVAGYEDRPLQLEMAQCVNSALEGPGVAIVEAPTGTGKTLAYLLPVLLYNRRTVISTRTKNLQEQIYEKDWPFLRDKLGFEAKVVQMKGRQNYLCRHRLHLFLQQPRFMSIEEATHWDRILAWTRSTQNGDRSELAFLPENSPTWNDINSNRHVCGGNQCKNYGDCYLQKMRREAAAADILIVNHHLFFADLAVKQTEHGEVIPDYHAVIFDEAHELEDVATAFFASIVSNYRLSELDRDLVRLISHACPGSEEFDRALRSLRSSGDRFFEHFHRDTDGKYRLRPKDVTQDIMNNYEHLRDSLANLETLCQSAGKEAESADLRRMSGRVREFREEAEQAMNLDKKEYVHYVEVRGRGVFVAAEPIEPAERVRDALFAKAGPVVFTSATLSTGGNFKYFRGRMGIDFEVEEKVLASCFDFRRQSVLYIPRDFPTPLDAGFMEAYLTQVRRILEATRGRAFLLFTSVKNMRAAYDELAGDLPYKAMIQGESTRTALLDRFRKDIHSVLFATSSFWEGVDVVGESLSCVVIDKLPFASPGEPIIEARIESINEKGGKAFFDYQVPQATITLKQGLGRLIRHRTDRGLLCLMDVRIRTKPYGRVILKSLPDFPVTGDLEEVLRYARALPSEDEQPSGLAAEDSSAPASPGT